MTSHLDNRDAVVGQDHSLFSVGHTGLMTVPSESGAPPISEALWRDRLEAVIQDEMGIWTAQRALETYQRLGWSPQLQRVRVHLKRLAGNGPLHRLPDGTYQAVKVHERPGCTMWGPPPDSASTSS